MGGSSPGTTRCHREFTLFSVGYKRSLAVELRVKRVSVRFQSDPLGLNAGLADGDANGRKRRSSEDQTLANKRPKVVFILSFPFLLLPSFFRSLVCSGLKPILSIYFLPKPAPNVSLLQVEPSTPISPSTPGAKPWSSAEDKATPATPTTPSPAPYRPAV